MMSKKESTLSYINISQNADKKKKKRKREKKNSEVVKEYSHLG